MDAGIADTINRRTARAVAARLDQLDALWSGTITTPWHLSSGCAAFTGENESVTNSDRAWFFGILAYDTPTAVFDGHPADCDWENLFSHFRAEILARRDPESPSVCAAESPARDGVGS